MKITNEIKNAIFNTAIRLDAFGIHGLAWEKMDAIRLIHFLMNKPIGILGGDAYVLHERKLEPLCDNWSCEIEINETEDSFFSRSKRKALEYLKSYPISFSKKIVFEIVFTETITLLENEPHITQYRKITSENCMAFITWSFPDFAPYWEKHLQFWNNQPRSLELDFCEFASFAIDSGITQAEAINFACFINYLLLTGDEEVKNSCNSGFISMMTEASYMGRFLTQTPSYKSLEGDSNLPIMASLFIWTSLEALRRSSTEIPVNLNDLLVFYEHALSSGLNVGINETNCAFFLLKEIPGFFSYWCSKVDPWYFMIVPNLFPVFMQYVIELVRNKDSAKFSQVSGVLERLLKSDSKWVQEQASECLADLVNMQKGLVA